MKKESADVQTKDSGVHISSELPRVQSNPVDSNKKPVAMQAKVHEASTSNEMQSNIIFTESPRKNSAAPTPVQDIPMAIAVPVASKTPVPTQLLFNLVSRNRST